MADRAGELQVRLDAVLRADRGVAAAFGANKTRIYDLPPQASAASLYPYITLADAQDVDDDYACADSGEVTVNIHVWSRTDPPGTLEAKRLAAAVRGAISLASLGDLPSNRVIDVLRQDSLFLQDPDGQTVHAVVRLQISLDAL